ncbi:hypothetical protein FHS78_001017 [Parvibaculum indicum]|uniref:hypothetical protein n=1 Tax=Parvibaculum indicum TaxID=562969 RepID=UPI0014228B91|nr:hypothetical protein [Parvibaculum indicum]NIJ40741.1 hypothetical protein [Parvibaculum indicum]
MTEKGTAPGPIMVMMLHGGPDRLKSALERISAAHPGAALLLLSHAGAEAPPEIPLAAHWRDGNMRGPLRFLALSRRLSWAGAACGYDLAPTARSRFLRRSVRPAIPWHEVEKTLPPVS